MLSDHDQCPRIIEFRISFINEQGQMRGVCLGASCGKHPHSEPLSVATFVPDTRTNAKPGTMVNDHESTDDEKRMALKLLKAFLFPEQ